MTERWNLKKFGDSADLIRDTIAPEAAQNVPYIGLEHIIEGGLTLSGYGFSDDVISAKNRFKKGDILFGKLRPYFRKVVIAPFDGVCSTDIWVVRAKAGTDQKFLFYWMASQEFVDNATRASEGTKMPRAKWEFVSLIEREVPPLPTQRAIARILGTLDNKIELNRRMNETLEAMARAIFKSWFVDFDPVRAKAGGRQPAGMDAETAALFPSEFEEEDGREVLKEWGVGRLSDVVGINEKSINQDYPFSNIDYIEISSVSEGKLDSVTSINRKEASSRAQRLVSHGDTIWSGVRPNRKSYLFIQKPKENLVVSTGFVTLSPKKIPPSYLYSWVTTESFADYLTANADGSAYPAVRADHFGDAEILLPLEKILAEFERNVAPLRAQMHINDEQSRALVQIRDALLPKLMSGEIQVDAG